MLISRYIRVSVNVKEGYNVSNKISDPRISDAAFSNQRIRCRRSKLADSVLHAKWKAQIEGVVFG